MKGEERVVHLFQYMPKILTWFSRYWLFQAIGWGLYVLINIFFAATYDRLNKVFLLRLLVFVILGLGVTHLMRFVIRQLHLLTRTLEWQIGGLLLLNVIFSFVIGILDTEVTGWLQIRLAEEINIGNNYVILSHTFYAFVYLFIWNMIYFVFHYINKSRSQQLDTLKLQSLVKDLELKTIKSHINPHFIFNALNSIRALIDEDPERARHAVTALGNILRSSMQADSVETVPLSRELSIVRDYLALEHIRFEDRLHVRYAVHPDTLSLPVPYMMLQTLVENAIKHGISRSINGGFVEIVSEKKGQMHIMRVRNSGRLVQKPDHEGFGLQSTTSRLLLHFGKDAAFTIQNLPDEEVEATVTIPIFH